MRKQWSTSPKRSLRRVAIIGLIPLWLLFGLVGNAEGSQIGIGLFYPGVYVQEFWRDSTPYFAVSNTTDSTVSLYVREAKTSRRGRGPTRLQIDRGPIVEKWEIPSGQTRIFDVSELSSMELVEVRQNQRYGGLLNPPREPPLAAKGKLVTYGSLNLGGGIGQVPVWSEQDSLVYRSRNGIELYCVVRQDRGRVVFGSKVELWRIINNRKEGFPPVDKNADGTPREEIDLPWLVIRNVRCTSLRVERENDLYTVYMSDPIIKKDYHVITLRYDFPKEEHERGAGVGIARMNGILIWGESQHKKWFGRGILVKN